MKHGASRIPWLLWALVSPASGQGPESAEATFLGRQGSVGLVELTGDYDRVLAGGDDHVWARQVVSRAFFEENADDYDFLVAFTTFPTRLDGDPDDGVDVVGLYTEVRNDTAGLGIPLFDGGPEFGSAARLQGYIDVGSLTQWQTSPLDPGFDRVLRLLGHELMHRWGVYVRFRDPDGAISEELLGHQESHWSPLADTGRGTLMYGNEWQEAGEGRFRSGLPRHALNPLDLYLAGFVEPGEVPPFRVLRTADDILGVLPRSGLEIRAEPIVVTVDDVIAAEGPREPPAALSQRHFRVGLLLLVRPGETTNDAQIAALERIARELEVRWSVLTGGRSVLSVGAPLVATDLEEDGPEPVSGGDLRPTAAVVADALSWLRGRQSAEGFWQDLEPTRVRDTAAAVDVLRRLDPFFVGSAPAAAWLGAESSASTDSLARRLLGLRSLGGNVAPALLSALRALQNSDGGWGLGIGYASDPLDTALALLALGSGDASYSSGSSYLALAQGVDGSWGNVAGGAGRIPATAMALRALGSRATPAARSAAVDWLAARQNPDGGFGDSPSTSHDTAWVLATLLAHSALDRVDAGRGSAYLTSRQSVEGSWDGSVHTTALAADAIRRLAFPNLRIPEAPSFSPDPALDGDGVRLLASLENDGGATAAPSLLEIYGGDPAGGAALIGSCDVPALPPGVRSVCEVIWDSTGAAGTHELVFLADARSALVELSETDNRAALAVEIGVSPLQADLELRANEVVVDPWAPSTLPVSLTVLAVVRNNGRTDAPGVLVRLSRVVDETTGATETLGEESLPLVAARSSLPIPFAYELRSAGSQELVLEADPDRALPEARDDNNRAVVTVTTTPNLDLLVASNDLEIVGAPLPGATVGLRVTLRNRGTVDATNVETMLLLETAEGGAPDPVVLLDEVVQVAAGASVTREVPWSVDREGQLVLVARVDPRNLAPESDESNNEARLGFQAGALGLPNLRLLQESLTVSPAPALEGSALEVRARVVNNGGALAAPVVVTLYEGHPAQGGVELTRVQQDALAPGEGSDLVLVAPRIDGAQDRVVFLIADPDEQLSEAVEDDNIVFRALTVTGLADLALSSSSLRLAPAFPEPGQEAQLTIEVANLGEQDAPASWVEVFDRDPLAGGSVLSTAPIGSLPAGSIGSAVASWTVSSDLEAGRPLQLVIVADRAEIIEERSESNNRATLETFTGGGAAQLSERWFSPNGDGVKDTTAFFFELPGTGAFHVEVRDQLGETVFASNAGAFAGPGTGQISWDGRDLAGHLAPDGDYSFHLVDEFDSSLASADVTLDTNRWPLLRAVGTAFEHTVDLSCAIPAGSSRDLALTADERWLFFEGGAGAQGGVYRVRLDGSGLQRVAEAGTTDLSVSDSGTFLAWRATQSLRFTEVAAGRPPRQVDLPSRPDRLLGFLPGEERVLALMDESVVRVDATNGAISVLYAAGAGDTLLSVADASTTQPRPGSHRRSLSPDGESLLLVRELPGGTRRLHVLDLVTGISSELGDFRTGAAAAIESIESATWLGGDARMALGKSAARRIEIADRSGGVLGGFALPADPPALGLVLLDGQQIPLPDGLEQGPPLVESLFSESGGGRLLVQLRYLIADPDGGCGISGSRESYWLLDLRRGTWSRVDEDAPPVLFTCGSFHIDVWEGGAFVERSVVHHGLRYRESAIELTGYLPDAHGELRLRVRQRGAENAHVDSLLLDVDGTPVIPISVSASDETGHVGGAEALALVGVLDHEVLPLGGGTLEAVWRLDSELGDRLSSGAPLRLLLAGREETLAGRRARPIELPAERERFWEVVIRRDGSLRVDGEQTSGDELGPPLFQERARPDTGHPQADVLGWVLSDGERLYAAIDFTVDNTRDFDGDWGALWVDAGSGWRELRVADAEQSWGRSGFGLTGAVRYRHRYYEFSVPLSELGLEVGETARIRFAGYGTAALLEDGGEPSLQTMTPLGFAGDRSHALFENRELGAPSLGLLLDEAETAAPVVLFDDWTRVRNLRPSPSGRYLFFRSRDPLEDPASDCIGINEEVMVLRSLANGTAQLDARLGGGGGVLLEGVASDLNFRRYTLEYAPVHDPEGWRLVAAPSDRQVLDGLLSLWTPPAAGSFLVRLTVEDRAGNVATVTRPVATAAPPDIADLSVAPRLVSPNGDGLADELVISYRVLRPVLLRVEIRDGDGRLVRAFDRSHPLSGENAELRWDGRDSRSLFAPDGTYSATVVGLELFFEVDRTPPEVDADVEVLGDVPLKGRLEVRVRDQHLDQGPLGVIERGEGEVPSAWTSFGEIESREPDDPRRPEDLDFDFELGRSSLLGETFRVDVRDAAGNRTVVLTEPVPEAVVPIGSGPDQLDLASHAFLLESVDAADLHGPEPRHAPSDPCFEENGPNWPSACGVTRLPTIGGLRLRVQTILRQPLAQLFIQYRPFAWELLGVAETEILWSERPVAAVFAPNGVAPTTGIPHDGFDLSWDLGGVDRSRLTVARLRGIDASGSEWLSGAFRLVPSQDVRFVGRRDEEDPLALRHLSESERGALLDELDALAFGSGFMEEDARSLLWGFESLDGALESAELFLQSDDDGRYHVEARFDAVAIADGVFLFDAPTLECANYRARLRTVDSSGKSWVRNALVRLPCLGISLALDPIPEPVCGALPGAESELGLVVVPRSLDGAPLKQLRVELRGVAPGSRRELLDNRNAPTSGEALRFDLDVSAFEEGEYRLIVSLSNDRDDSRSASRQVFVDRTPPVLDVTSPLEAQSVCGAAKVEGRAHDLVSGLRVHLEMSGDSLCTATSAYAGDLASEQGWILGALRGELGTVSGCAGEVDFRVIASDRAGNTTCVERHLSIDAAVLGTRIETAGTLVRSSKNGTYQVLSPNGDGVSDELDVEIESAETTFADVEVYALRNAQACLSRELPDPVRSPERLLASALPVSGATMLLWDGRDEAGVPVPSGLYAVVSRFEDACRNHRTETDCAVVVDTDPPLLELTHPAAGASISGLADVRGSVVEQRPMLVTPLDGLHSFDSYELDFRLDALPDDWRFIAASDRERPSESAHLATWRLSDTAGPVTLRLRASDLAGNRSELEVPVQVFDVPVLVSELEPVPRLFSPNGDGRRDAAAIRFTLDEPTIVDLAVLGAGGAPVRSFLTARASNAGAAVLQWDGLDDTGTPAPDGEYDVEIVARRQGQQGDPQRVRTVLLLDRTPPAIELLEPASLFVRPQAEIAVEITDAHPATWKLDLASATGGEPMAWETLASGEGTAAGVVARLGDLPEGDYRLRLSAIDEAESATELEAELSVDTTPPLVTMLAPAEGASFGNEVTIQAHLDEAHRSSYRVEIAPGTEPVEASFALLAEATSQATDVLETISLSDRTEGPFTLRIVARDLAGNAAEARRRVLVDRSPPRASITVPAPDTWVREPLAVRGEASDANLGSWTLSLHGVEGAPAGFTVELGHGEEGVAANGALLTWAALPPDGRYELRLLVRDLAGNETVAGVVVEVDRTPPLPPQGFAGTVEPGGAAVLRWHAGLGPDLAGYQLLRNGMVVSEPPANATSATDAGLFEGRYEYTLVAVDRAGNASEPAGPVALLLDTTPPEIELLRPRTGERVGGVVDIVGTAASSDDLHEFRVLLASASTPAEPALIRRSPVPTRSDLLGQWNSAGVPDGSGASVVLEAEDIAGNVARVSVAVIVDHGAPAVPDGLAASVTGDDVDLTWQPNSEADLLGYVLLRDGAPVVSSSGDADLRSVALRESAYRDLDLPDGAYAYQVLAVDQAGNVSGPSAPVAAALETGPPLVLVVLPEEGQRVEGVVTVLAESAARDVTAVRFEVRSEGAAVWSLLAEDVAEPWSAEWDARSDPFGIYELRAIARDASGVEGPADVVSVELTELTPPPAPLSVQREVDGGDVTLSWPAVEVGDLAGYHVERAFADDAEAPWLRLTLEPLVATSATDSGIADGTYRYRVVAADVHGNESEPSPEVAARVYSLLFVQPWTPTADVVLGPVAGRGPEGTIYRVDAELEAPDGIVEQVPPFDTGTDGAFVLPELVVSRGRSVLRARLVDGLGQRSKLGSVVLVSAPPPVTPTGFEATVSGFEVTLGWEANPEPAIAGYQLLHLGEPVVLSSSSTPVSATASSSRSPTSTGPQRAIDGSATTYWSPAVSGGPLEPSEWIEVTLAGNQVLAGVELQWRAAEYVPVQARVEGWSGEVWVPLAQVPEDMAVATVLFPRPYATDRLRLRIDETSVEQSFDPARLAEIRALRLGLVAGLGFAHQVSDGLHHYELAAVDSLGLASPAAELDVPVGDTTAPEAVVLNAAVRGSEVDLSWTASASVDVAGYALYRDDVLLELREDGGWLSFTDGPLTNGTYRYHLTVLDGVGNESAPSNEVQVEIAEPVPMAPLLALVAVDAGSVSLAWTPALEGPVPVIYSLRRASAGGGPYSQVVVTGGLDYTDSELDPEETYYYVVAAVDGAGNESEPSNEVSAAPADSTAPAAPILFHPTRPGELLLVEELHVDVAGFAEPGARVALARGATFRGETIAVAEWRAERTGRFARGVDFHDDGARAVAVEDDGSLWLLGLEGSAEPVATGVVVARWSGDDHVLVATDTGELRRLEPSSSSNSAITTADAITEIAVATLPSGEALRAFLLASRQGQAGVWRLDLSTGGWALVVGADEPSEMHGLSVAPRERYLVVERDLDGLVVLDLSSEGQSSIDLAGAGPVAWSPDGDAFLYVRESGGVDQVWRFDVASATASQVTDESAGATRPLWAPDGGRYAYVRSGEGLVVAKWGGVSSLGPVLPLEPQWAVWTRGGTIGALDLDEVVRLVPAGLFRFEGVELRPGTNVFAARARDQAGQASEFSESIAVELEPDTLSDLELRSAELRAVPPAVQTLAPVRLSALVRNRGAHSAPRSEIALALEDAAGSEVWSRRLALPEILPGQSATIFHDLAIELAGEYRLRGRADAGNAIAESDETNNEALRELRVLESGAARLELHGGAVDLRPGRDRSRLGERVSGRRVPWPASGAIRGPTRLPGGGPPRSDDSTWLRGEATSGGRG